MKTGVNTKANLRIARKATLEVLFQGKVHHTDKVLLLWNQLYWQSCSLYCLITLLPGVHTHEISFPIKSMCCQHQHVCTEGLLLAQRCPAKAHLFSPFTERAVPAEAYGVYMALVLAELVYSSTFVKVLVMLSVVWHSAVHEPQPLNVSMSINPC